MTPFLFASPDGRRTSSSASARRVHLRRLSDILHLSIQRGDLLLAQRSFAILSRCEDVEWAAIWKFGLIVLAAAAAAEEHHSADRPPAGNDDMPQQLELGTPKHVEFLRIMMLRHPEERESLVRELVLSLTMAGRERDALDELELYLPSPPYQDNSVLHTYAGLICLRLALSSTGGANDPSGRNAQGPGKPVDASAQTLLREAQQHLERARALDPEGVIAQAFIHRLTTLTGERNTASNESEDDTTEADSNGLGRKRIRT